MLDSSAEYRQFLTVEPPGRLAARVLDTGVLASGEKIAMAGYSESPQSAQGSSRRLSTCRGPTPFV